MYAEELWHREGITAKAPQKQGSGNTAVQHYYDKALRGIVKLSRRMPLDNFILTMQNHVCNIFSSCCLEMGQWLEKLTQG